MARENINNLEKFILGSLFLGIGNVSVFLGAALYGKSNDTPLLFDTGVHCASYSLPLIVIGTAALEIYHSSRIKSSNKK